jgi:thiol-disulfide isomerase/thioredoxin
MAAESVRPAAPLQLPDAQGKPIDLASLRGKVVYLDFWASWCVPCRQSFPFMNKLKQQHEAEGLVVLAVNVDAEGKDAADFLAHYPASFSVVYDPAGKAPAAWGVAGMPTSFLIDRQGKVRASHLGFRAADTVKIEAELAPLLKEAAQP